MNPWRFNPATGSAAANRIIRSGGGALSALSEWVDQAADLQEAMAAVIAARIAVAPLPAYGGADTFRSDAPPLPHHPFVMSLDLPFLPAATFEAGGAMLAPADQIEACFQHGVLRQTPLEPGDPIQAVLALLASEQWNALILPDASRRASRMVRWQAVRATCRTDLLARCDPEAADDDQFERWWQDCIRPE
jgi:hypothetical protein